LTFEELEARRLMARSIGVNFGADAGLVLSAAEVAGFVPQANWNNIPGQPPGAVLTRSDLTINNDGIASQSTVDINVDFDSLSGNVSGVITNHGGTINTPNRKIYQAYADVLGPSSSNHTEGTFLTITGLAGMGTFDLIIYSAGTIPTGEPDRVARYDFYDGTSRIAPHLATRYMRNHSNPVVGAGDAFVEGLDNGTAAGTTVGNYFIVRDLNASSGSLHIFADGVIGSPERGAINGMQLVFEDTPPPPPPPLEPLPTDAGEWWQLRGNQHLTGRSELAGDFSSQPEVVWQQFVGARVTLLESKYDAASDTTVLLPTMNIGADQAALNQKWGINTEYFDLDGNGALTAMTVGQNSKVGEFLPSSPGLEMIVFGSSRDSADNKATGQLYKRQNFQWAPVWETERVYQLEVPTPVVGDFDNDGVLEVAVLAWYDLWVFDIVTGQTEQVERFMPNGSESGRAYGWFGAYDVDANGTDEFVIVSDSENHVEVLGYGAGGNVAKLWDTLYEVGVTGKETKVASGVDPVQDINGDGQLDITISLFNTKHDGRWHVISYNALTGAEILDLVDKQLIGLEDLDNDGTAELFVSATVGSLQSDPSNLTIHSFKNNVLTTRWQRANSAFQQQGILAYPLHANRVDFTGGQTLLSGRVSAGGRPVFFTRDAVGGAGENVNISVWVTLIDGSIVLSHSFQGPNLEAVATRIASAGQPSVLLETLVPGNVSATIQTVDSTVVAVQSRLATIDASPALVGRLTPGSLPAVIVQGANEHISSFRPGATASQWRQPGRGTYTGGIDGGGGVINGGVMLGDLLGDGLLETIAATTSELGEARLVAYNPDGSELWHYDFEGIPGRTPPWDTAGLTYWYVGDFTPDAGQEVAAVVRQISGATEKVFMLSGADGHAIWTRDVGGSILVNGMKRSPGGDWAAAADVNGDGWDDLITTKWEILFAMSGPTGNVLLDVYKPYTYSVSPPFNGVPFLDDFLGNGRLQILDGGTHTGGMGLTNLTGGLMWQVAAPNVSQSVMPGIGDVDGDGKLEILNIGPGGTTVSAFDATTGALEWTLNVPGSTGEAHSGAMADLNGDGRYELVFTRYNQLIAVGMNSAGTTPQVLWQMSFDSRVGLPTLADATGDGRLEIVVVSEQGYVYGISTPPNIIAGDFNADGSVDAADYVVWRNSLGQAVPLGTGADGNRNAVIDSGDRDVWFANFGKQQSPGGTAAATNSVLPNAGIGAARDDSILTTEIRENPTSTRVRERLVDAGFSSAADNYFAISGEHANRRHPANSGGQRSWPAYDRAKANSLNLALSGPHYTRPAASHGQLGAAVLETLSRSEVVPDNEWDDVFVAPFAWSASRDENCLKNVMILD
jgi:hypothetical protein